MDATVRTPARARDVPIGGRQYQHKYARPKPHTGPRGSGLNVLLVSEYATLTYDAPRHNSVVFSIT
jgi:hypothetical protein